jgi:DNA transposition AAA+ family ATPase
MSKTTPQKAFWHTEPTIQFQEIITTLQDCKQRGSTALIIAPTGNCKSYSIDKFCEKNPEHTYRITINNLYKLRDLIYELADLTGAQKYFRLKNISHSHKLTLDAVVERLRIIRAEGGRPVIIIDEGENMELALMKVMKGLYDRIKDHCAIVLIGTHRLVGRMLNQNDKGGSLRQREALPELYRRFKAYHKTITPINKKRDFAAFFKRYIPGETGLHKLLCDICENYGELHDYLVPALQEADERNAPLTEDMFRIMYNLPKYQ